MNRLTNAEVFIGVGIGIGVGIERANTEKPSSVSG